MWANGFYSPDGNLRRYPCTNMDSEYLSILLAHRKNGLHELRQWHQSVLVGVC